MWYGKSDEDFRATIQGQEITWWDGTIVKVTYGLRYNEKSHITVFNDGEYFTGELTEGGIIKWDDGDIWIHQGTRFILK